MNASRLGAGTSDQKSGRKYLQSLARQGIKKDSPIFQRMPDVRPLVAGDVDELRQLLKECWLDTYTGILPDSVIRNAISSWQSRENLLRGLNNVRAYHAGYTVDGKLVGMVSVGKLDQETLKVFQLYVHPNHQRKGIGRLLMDAALAHYVDIRKVVLEVEVGNQKGISFYRKYGFDYPTKARVKVDGDEIPCLVGELQVQRT